MRCVVTMLEKCNDQMNENKLVFHIYSSSISVSVISIIVSMENWRWGRWWRSSMMVTMVGDFLLVGGWDRVEAGVPVQTKKT